MGFRKQQYLWLILQLVLIVSAVIFVGSGIRVSQINLSTQSVDLLNLEQYSLGPVYNEELLFQYYQGRGSLKVVQEGEERFLRFDNTQNKGYMEYNGFGMNRSLYIPQEAQLHLEIRAAGRGDKIDLHLIDTPPSSVKDMTGEHYLYNIPFPDYSWTYSEIPLSLFRFNSWQSENTYIDKVKNLQPLSSIQIGLPSGTEGTLDVKTLEIVWSQSTNNFLIALGFLGSLTVLLFILSFNLSPRRLSDQGEMFSLVYIRIGFLLTSLWFALQASQITELKNLYLLELIIALLLTILIMDHFLPLRLRKHILFRHRYWIAIGVSWFFLPEINYFAYALMSGFALYPFLFRKEWKTAALVYIFYTILLFLYPSVTGHAQFFILSLYLLFSCLIAYGVIQILKLGQRNEEMQKVFLLYNSLMNNANEFILTLSIEGEITDFNRSFGNQAEISHKDHIKLQDLIPREDHHKLLHGKPQEGDSHGDYDTTLHFPGGREIPVHISEHEIRQSGELIGYQVIALDISERKVMEEELKEANKLLRGMAVTDELTQMANRRFFDQQLDLEYRKSRRSKNPLSLIIIDIDHFKNFNDTLGHQQGDKCLQSVSAKMKATLTRAGDILCRYGGEEFAIILPDYTSQSAAKTAQKVVEAIGELKIPHPSSVTADWVTISAGIYTENFGKESKGDPQTIIYRADKALYEAKRTGRNKWVTYTPDIETLQ